ncbi:fungal protein [Colletotrichum higginsianum]|nr:fungal protein [Colletotrichum higginsianum]
MASPQTPALDAEQTKALFNILTHFETYHEIEDFKKPETVSNYGYPFAQTQTQTQTQPQTSSRAGASNGVTYAPESSAPLLQSLFTRFVLKLPGVSTLAPEFWNVQVQGILRNFAEADLDPATRPATYNLESARDLAQAWDDAMHDLVYGDLCDDLLDHLAQTDDFESHSPMTRAANEYIILHLASLAHQVLVISPEGQYLVKLMEQVHKMVPYNMVRQTLKVGNAATMIAGMMKIFLAKLSVGSVSNWFGITKDAADGMNLMQRIISVILGWDCAEFKKTVDRISKAKNRPSKGALDAIRAHTESSHGDREAIRAKSQSQDRSIIAVMLETANPVLLSDMSEDEHAMCLEFYAALLGMRDREEIISILCKQSPDLLTQAVREAVAGFDPIIRAVHNKVDLSDHLRDAQTFIDQLIATSKPKKGGRSKDDAESMPTVEDFVQLCKNNKQLLYKWLHAVGKNCPEVMDQFRAWAKDALVAFHKTAKGGESIEDRLGGLFGQVPEKTRVALVPIIDAHAAYLRELDELSLARMQAILEGGSASMAGPGVYLVRWQSLMDETLITPARPAGPVRQGKDVKSAAPLQGKRASGSSDTSQVVAAVRKMSISSLPEAPDVKPVIKALAPMFKRQLAISSRANGPRVNGSTYEEGAPF